MAKEALHWIVGLLRSRSVPFVVCGGLAARGYGSTRPLHDIDLFVPAARFAEVVQAGGPFTSKPAQRYREEGWNVEYVQFIYHGTKIELGNAEGVEVQDHATGQWVALEIDFAQCERACLFGEEVPLMAREHLVAYKRHLGRPVDLVDVEAIERHQR